MKMPQRLKQIVSLLKRSVDRLPVLTRLKLLGDRWLRWQQQYGSDELRQPAKASQALSIPSDSDPNKSHRWHRWDLRSPILVCFAVLCLTATLGDRFYDAPKLDVGIVAPQTIYAPASARVEDTKTTDEKRQEARSGATAILKIDPVATQEILTGIQAFLRQGSEARRMAGTFPLVPPSILTRSVQIYLRQADESEFQPLVHQLEPKSVEAPNGIVNPDLLPPLDALPLSLPFSKEQQDALQQLTAYRQSQGNRSLSTLLETIAQSRWDYRFALNIMSERFAQQESLYQPGLLNLSEAEWQATQAGMQRSATLMLAQGIHPGLPKEVLNQALVLQIEATVPQVARTIALEVLSSLMRPNLIKDPQQTGLLAEQAAQRIDPVMVTVERGDVIVQVGEPITHPSFVLLDHFGLSRRGINWWGLGSLAGVVSLAIGLFRVIQGYVHPRLRRRDYILIFLLTLSAPLVVSLGISATSLPAIGLLIGSFYGSIVGITVVGLLSLILPLGMQISGGDLMYSAFGGLVGALVASRLRSREELALLGGAVGLTQAVTCFFLSILSAPIWYITLGSAFVQGLIGLAWSIVALGLSPYLEHLFDLVTPIRLSELANPNRPLLKRLAAEAPGTFQHTLFVSTLAEAAARILGCNVELVRTGTLYHDIGKMHDPLSFIENQMGNPNKHDAIGDPWQSAIIIKKHVSEGLVMAKKYRLPKAVRAFIPEHQGTMLIGYFYHQAQQQRAAAANDPEKFCMLPLQEADFRYDGPTPQSRETGIVMLADSCEAALRSLKEVTPEEALVMINKILKARWQDQQLVDSGLTREDMTRIADVFLQVWQQSNHQRISYPKACLRS